MLQIISGKFFGGGEVNEEDCHDVLYSNYSWGAEIGSSIAQMHRAAWENTTPATYIVNYKNRFEKVGDGPGLVMASSAPVLDQLRLIASIYFRALFHPDRTHVELLTRSTPRHSNDATFPSAFVTRYFDLPVSGTFEEVSGFSTFMTRIIGLPREQYNLLVSCLRTFFNALEACPTNFDLAYSMFAYVLEALSQSFDEYTPQWEDFEKHAQIDNAVRNVDAETVERIRSILLRGQHLKLTKRFIDGIGELVQPEFFKAEAHGIRKPLPRSELRRSLQNLYATRSGYVHSLKVVIDQLRMPNFAKSSDYIVWDNEPYLTLSGLVRLTRHVLVNFVTTHEQLEVEDYPWRNELPGKAQAQWAPEYWIWQAGSFVPEKANERFSGFVCFLTYNMRKADMQMPYMKDLMIKIESLFDQAKAKFKPSMLALYFTYHKLIVSEGRSPNADRFLQKWQKADSDECSIQWLAVCLLLDYKHSWCAEDCATVSRAYEKQKYKTAGVSLPLPLELAISLMIANSFLAKGDIAKFDCWMEKASLDSAYDPNLQAGICYAKTNNVAVDTWEPLRLNDFFDVTAWTFDAQPPSIKHGNILRIYLDSPATVRWSADDWGSHTNTNAVVRRDGKYAADITLRAETQEITFTFFWLESQSWEGNDFTIAVIESESIIGTS